MTARGVPKDADPSPTAMDRLDLEHFLPYQLVVLADWVSRSLATRYQKRFGISVPEWRILAQLSRRQPQSAGALSECTNMDKPRVSRALQRMEARGLILRERDPRDQRIAVIRLGAPGIEIYAEIAPLALQWEQHLLADFSESERAALDRLLERLHTRLLKMQEDEPDHPTNSGNLS